jgi:hypothetical protein
MEVKGFFMASGDLTDEAAAGWVRLHHGADLTSANNILQHGIDEQQAAVWNGSGEFWTTTNHVHAEWFARSNPNSPPAACFEFDLPGAVLQVLLQMHPPGARYQAPNDYEFLPPGYALLNQHLANPQVVPVP